LKMKNQTNIWCFYKPKDNVSKSLTQTVEVKMICLLIGRLSKDTYIRRHHAHVENV